MKGSARLESLALFVDVQNTDVRYNREESRKEWHAIKVMIWILIHFSV